MTQTLSLSASARATLGPFHDGAPSSRALLAMATQHDRRRLWTGLANCLRDGTGFEGRFEFRHPNPWCTLNAPASFGQDRKPGVVTAGNSILTLRLSAEADYGTHGQCLGLRGTVEVVDPSSHDERPQSEQMLSAAVDSLTDGFLLLDLDLRIAFINDRVEGMLRIDRQDLIGRTLPEVLAKPEWADLHDILRRVISGGKSSRIRVAERGTARIWQLKAFPSENGLVIFLRDVAAEQQAKGWLRLLETAIDRINDLVMVTDARPLTAEDGPRVIYVNEAFERVVGYCRDELTGTVPAFLRPGNTSVEGAELITQAVRAQQPVRAEIRCHSRGGQDLWLEVDLVPLFDEHGILSNWVSIMRDVTERRRIENRLREMQKLETVAKLSGDLAHDFNNLLTVIIGNSEALSEVLEEDPPMKRLADLSLGAAERGAELTARLLAFGRRQQLSTTPSDLAELLDANKSRLTEALRPGIALDLEANDGVWPVSIDRETMTDSVTELVCNARDAIHGDGHIVITVANMTVPSKGLPDWPELPPGRYVAVSVADDGIGMTPETANRAIEPFFSTKRKASAAGLGLSSLFGFVRQSGGDARIVSTEGMGTTVTMIFPAIDTAIAPLRRSRTHPQSHPAELASGQKTLRVLVVEDNPMVRENLIRQLERRGHTVTAAKDGSEGLGALISAEPFDLLISDVVMPGSMDGVELARTARKLRKGLKVLLVSGFTDHAVRQKALTDPDLAFVGKPYRFDALMRAVQDLLAPPAPLSSDQSREAG